MVGGNVVDGTVAVVSEGDPEVVGGGEGEVVSRLRVVTAPAVGDVSKEAVEVGIAGEMPHATTISADVTTERIWDF